MFQNIRQNSQVYILHKNGKPSLEIGIVKDVSTPMPKYPMSPHSLYTPQEMVIDLVVSVGDKSIPFNKISTNADVAEFVGDGVIIATNRESMNTEVISLKQRSLETINSIEYHREVVSSCDEILNTLNPEYAERQKQQDEMRELKSQVEKLTSLLMSSGASKNK